MNEFDWFAVVRVQRDNERGLSLKLKSTGEIHPEELIQLISKLATDNGITLNTCIAHVFVCKTENDADKMYQEMEGTHISSAIVERETGRFSTLQ